MCFVCDHTDRVQIENEIKSGMLYKHVSARYNVSEPLLSRHAREHMRIIRRDTLTEDARSRVRELAFENTELRKRVEFLETELTHTNARLENHRFYFSLYEQAEQKEATKGNGRAGRN